MADTINYGNMMHRAMRGLIAEVLQDVADHGLPGEHHFFVTLDTRHPDVVMADWLLKRYPEEITIVIQHWFENLVVGEDGFQITLSFGDQPVPLIIPFDAIRTFVDPSVEFGLRFETQEDDDADDERHEVVELHDLEDGPAASAHDDAEEEPATAKDAEVVSLDSFRK